MLVLGVETSCDETALALVQDGNQVLCSLVSSQIKVHERFGGVVPEVAAREHLKALEPLWVKLSKEVPGFKADAIAVTQGPGLLGCLLVGISFAKGLALESGLPLIPVNHVRAHLHGGLLGIESSYPFPCLGLVASGGHTNLYLWSGPCDFTYLAGTKDDACGECFDKVGKVLGLGYPGGPEIEKMAARAEQKDQIQMPRVGRGDPSLGFSYSGLKTHMANLARKLDGADLAPVCASFQEEALRQIVVQLNLAKQAYPEVRCAIIAGGVAANQRFREMMANDFPLPAYFPSLKFCGDNAAMIAAAGYHKYQERPDSPEFVAPWAWDAFSRYSPKQVGL